jgi:hypothetical protein
MRGSSAGGKNVHEYEPVVYGKMRGATAKIWSTSASASSTVGRSSSSAQLIAWNASIRLP